MRIKLGHIDLMALDVGGTVTAHLDADSASEVGNATEDGDDDDSLSAGPLTIAVDVNEAPAGDN